MNPDGLLFIAVWIVIGFIHKGLIPMVNRLRKLQRIEKRMGYEISEWYATEDFK